MALSNKQIKQRHFDKVYANAEIVKCACGCGKETKNKDRYARPKSYINGHNGRKYQDLGEYKRQWNYRNRKYRYNVKKQRCYRLKARFINQKGGKCCRCGLKYNGKNGCIFQFHHKNPKNKKIPLNMASFQRHGKETLSKEIRKCDLVCANCHFIIHSGEY